MNIQRHRTTRLRAFCLKLECTSARVIQVFRARLEGALRLALRVRKFNQRRVQEEGKRLDVERNAVAPLLQWTMRRQRTVRRWGGASSATDRWNLGVFLPGLVDCSRTTFNSIAVGAIGCFVSLLAAPASFVRRMMGIIAISVDLNPRCIAIAQASLLSAIIGFTLAGCVAPERRNVEFSSEAWISALAAPCGTVRQSMLDNVVKEILHQGMLRSDVERVLGAECLLTSNEGWSLSYRIRCDSRSGPCSFLLVHLDGNGVVSGWSQVEF